MKKILFIFIFIFSITLTSCSVNKDNNIDNPDSGDSKEPIVYNQMVVDVKFLKSAATCTTKAVYYYSSINGDIGSETFEYGEVLGHHFVNNVCDRCNLYNDGIEWGELH